MLKILIELMLLRPILSIRSIRRPSPKSDAGDQAYGGRSRDGLPGGVQNTCPICARFRAMLGTVEGVLGRFRTFFADFAL